MSFNEMSVSDKDAVISVTYGDVAMDMSWLLGATESQSLHLQITNTFNKVTADMNPQVLTYRRFLTPMQQMTFESLWQKEKLLIMSNFSICRNYFNSIQ